MLKEFSYKEAMEILKISRASFYNRLEKSKNSLDNHIVIKDGKKYITNIGIEILKNSNINTEKLSETSNSKEIERLEAQIKMMAEQLAFHQDQIREKDIQIKTLTSLHQNEQLLLKQAQDQYKLLSESKEVLDTIEKKSFWSFLKRV